MKTIVVAAVVSVVMGAGAYQLGKRSVMEPRKVHTLDKPLRIATANESEHFYLPAGTVLYHDTAMAEGFDRYQVYINVPGGLELTKPEKPGLIAPLSGYFDEAKK